MQYNFQPIILIGAARSGTKLVRDLIAVHPAVDRVPYDINYIWRLGCEQHPHDELSPDLLTPSIKEQIQSGFQLYHAGAPFIIEKTVSNCLRIPYVYTVFPKARFIHLLRDGRDVVESAYRQWMASPDWRYIIQKARTYPLTKAPRYALNYALKTFRKLLASNTKQPATWGPRYAGIDQDVATKPLLEVCAIQWARCVEKASTDLKQLPSDQVLTIHYEDFVRNPHKHLAAIARFVGLDPVPYVERVKSETVSQQNIGKGFRNLGREQRAIVLSRIQPLLIQNKTRN